MRTEPNAPVVAPRQKRARLTRDRIFRAAAAVFAEHGPAGARIHDIASRAGVNRQRLYAYFGRKHELYTCWGIA